MNNKETNLKEKMCKELIEKGKVQENDVIRHSYTSSRLSGEMKDIQDNNMCPTLDTRCDCLGVVVEDKGYSDESLKRIKNNVVENDVAPTITANAMQSINHQNCALVKIGNYGNGHHAKDVFDPDGLSPTITIGNHGLGQTIAIKNNTKKGYLEAETGDGINIGGRMEYQRGNVQKGLSQTLSTMGGQDVGVVVPDETKKLRIRKLTPKECLRLMGFTDEDYESMRSIGMSDSAIYHMAGDSIVVPVLMAIFSNLINEDDQHEQIIRNYIKKGILQK